MKEKLTARAPLKTPRAQISRRDILTLSGASIAASLLPVSALITARAGAQKEDIMAQANADRNGVRPFQVNFPDADLADLRRRIHAARWPDRETVNDASQGVQLATTQKLARAWTEYDWRRCEA
jgi:hypothetical protein